MTELLRGWNPPSAHHNVVDIYNYFLCCQTCNRSFLLCFSPPASSINFSPIIAKAKKSVFTKAPLYVCVHKYSKFQHYLIYNLAYLISSEYAL